MIQYWLRCRCNVTWFVCIADSSSVRTSGTC